MVLILLIEGNEAEPPRCRDDLLYDIGAITHGMRQRKMIAYYFTGISTEWASSITLL